MTRSPASAPVVVEQQPRTPGTVEQGLHGLDDRAHPRAERRRIGG
jgi:hypothetical protein